MSKKRVADVAMLQGLVNSSMKQEVPKGVQRTTDPNFPVFTTPVNRDILVYIPMTNVIQDENGATMQVLPSLIHAGRRGRQFLSLRCISGLQGDGFDALGYDGTCPACDATQEAWELYNFKMKAEAERLGVDPQNDPGDTLKPTREKLLREKALDGAEEFVTFPIVIIPTKARFTPADDAVETMEVVYVNWRKSRYEEKVLKSLNSLMKNPGHPAGMFWIWDFTYDTKGKEANSRDSALNATYTPISASDAGDFEMFKQPAEEKAKEFTLLKAAEVIVANQFIYKEDLESEVNKVMENTRKLLELSSVGAGAPALGGGAQGALGAPNAAGGNPLANFGQSPQPDQQQNLGQAPPQQPHDATQQQPQQPNQFGQQQQPNQQGQPQQSFNNPVQFGQQ